MAICHRGHKGHNINGVFEMPTHIIIKDAGSEQFFSDVWFLACPGKLDQVDPLSISTTEYRESRHDANFVELQVVIMTNSCVTNDNKVGIMTTLISSNMTIKIINNKHMWSEKWSDCTWFVSGCFAYSIVLGGFYLPISFRVASLTQRQSLPEWRNEWKRMTWIKSMVGIFLAFTWYPGCEN